MILSYIAELADTVSNNALLEAKELLEFVRNSTKLLDGLDITLEDLIRYTELLSMLYDNLNISQEDIYFISVIESSEGLKKLTDKFKESRPKAGGLECILGIFNRDLTRTINLPKGDDE